ncbi:MAG: hypothetical protein JO048_17345 [Methylobacteriaceae bacterium]|nr:hypothetical protein [Methylobacteriaceae bacterium]
MTLDPAAIDSLSALGLGFAFAGLTSSGFELVAGRPLGFGLLNTGGVKALAAVPVLVFSAPLLIIRNTIRGRRFERRPIHFVMIATIIACFWSLLSGRVVFDAAAHLLAGA